MMEHYKELPKGWERIPFKKACNKISLTGIKVKQKNYKQFGCYPIIDQGQKLISGYWDNDELLVPGEPPFVLFGDHTKTKKFVNFRFVAGGDGLKVIQPNDFFNPKLFYYFLHAIQLPDKGYARHFQYLEKSYIMLPPINEQNRIVEKIEELFSEIDKGIEYLQTAKEQLEVYRQAVLKAAFEGNLTLAWRQCQKIGSIKQKLRDEKRPKSEVVSALAEIPNEWQYVYLGSLGELSRGKSKHRPRNDERLFKDGIYPFIQTGEVKAARKYITEYSQTYNEFGLSQSKLWPKGTLCITIAANIADTAFLGFDACFPDSIVGFIADNEKVLIDYIYYFLNYSQKRIEFYAPATAQKNINLTTLENLLIPYCSKKEQHRIVQEIESRLSVCDYMEETVEKGLAQAEALKQSILKKAFEGRLVPQDPDDEPAAVLLERIRAEKRKQDEATTAATKKTKKGKKKHE